MLDSTLKTARGISYSQLYEGDIPNIESLIEKVPSKTAIAFVSYIIFQMDFRRISKYGREDEFSIIAPVIMQTDEEMKRRFYNFTRGQVNPIDHYINRYAFLQLIDLLLSHHNNENRALTTDDYSNLLKAYLVFCEKHLNLTAKVITNMSFTAEDMLNYYLPVQLLTNDIEYPQNIALELIKSNKFFVDFPKQDKAFAHYFSLFLKYKGLKNASDYMICVFQPALILEINDLRTNEIGFGPENSMFNTFMDNICVDINNYQPDEHLNSLRERPVYKLEEGKYAILSMKFFISKLFGGVLFDMADGLTEIHEFDNRVKAYNTLKQRKGEVFSEQFLLYGLLHNILGKRFPVQIEAPAMRDKIGSGEPDYYARRNDRVFVFEFKDIQMNQVTKTSVNSDVIKSYLYENFVQSKSGRAKGVGQLAKVISEKLSAIYNNVDSHSAYNRLKIYPVLVYSDNNFDIEGVSYYLQKEFKKIKPSVDGYDIKDVIMVSIDMLMMFEIHFKNSRLKFDVIVNEYLAYRNSSSKLQAVPFNKYLFQYAHKKRLMYKHSQTFHQTFDDLLMMEKDMSVNHS